jgi:hypothetical protein
VSINPNALLTRAEVVGAYNRAPGGSGRLVEPSAGFRDVLDAVALAQAEKAARVYGAEIERLQAHVQGLEDAITRVVQDAESQHPGGWGPDVTTVAYLKAALGPQAQEGAKS